MVNLGYKCHPGRTVINLAPAELEKDAGAYDLPIAIALLVATDQLPTDHLADHRATGRPRKPRTGGATKPRPVVPACRLTGLARGRRPGSSHDGIP